MTRLLLALIVLLALPLSAQAQHPCDRKTSFRHTAATPRYEIVPGVADQRVYLCGFMIAQKGPTLDFQITAGSGGNCVNSTPDLAGPVYSVPNDFALTNRIETVGPYSDVGDALCLETFGTGGLTGEVYWAQF